MIIDISIPISISILQQSIISPINGIPYLNLGTEVTLNTRYLEFQDGTIMTDGIMVDRENTSFTGVYGAGYTTHCVQIRGDTGVATRCTGNGVNLCEITLEPDTHVCLNKDTLDSSVTLNATTELTLPTSIISSSICIEYCRGSAEQHKYAIIGTDKCTCATDITFDANQSPKNKPDADKQLSNKCSWSSSKTMLGNDDNNVVAFYNTDYSIMPATAKLAPSHCRVFEHELFYSQYMERFALQSEIKRPVLRVGCDYKGSGICSYPLLHNLPSSQFASEGGTGFWNPGFAKKMYTHQSGHVPYLETYTSRSLSKRIGNTWYDYCDDGECLVQNQTLSNGDFLALDDLKIVIDLPNPSLITGLWWSTAYPTSNFYGRLSAIHNLEFNMAGRDYKSQMIENVVKGGDNGRRNLEVTLLPYPILTDTLKLSGLQYYAGNDWDDGHRIRFNIELFGCENYEIDACKFELLK